MATKPVRRSALMSIRPQFSEAILDGTKQVEFRKRRLAPDISKVLIYTTSPIQAVVGEFTVAGQVEGTPLEIWRRFRKVAGIDRASFFEYFADNEVAVGILIEDVIEYNSPRTLDQVGPGVRPPQSFMYLKSA